MALANRNDELADDGIDNQPCLQVEDLCQQICGDHLTGWTLRDDLAIVHHHQLVGVPRGRARPTSSRLIAGNCAGTRSSGSIRTSAARGPRQAAATPDKQLGFGIVNPYRALTDVDFGTPGPSPTPFGGRAPDPTKAASTTGGGKLAVVLGLAALVGVGLATALFAAYPSERRRGWKA